MKRGCLLCWKNLLVRFTRDGLTADMEGSFELAIDMEIAALRIFQKHQVRAIIKNGPEPRFAFTEFFLHSLAFGGVAQGTRQEVAGHLPFDQIVLRTGLN